LAVSGTTNFRNQKDAAHLHGSDPWLRLKATGAQVSTDN